MGVGKKSHLVYAIDFGLAKRFIDPKTGKHNAHCFKNTVAGTVRYQSLNAHLKWEQSRRDDLEAIGYVLAYFLRGGNLPWSLKQNKDDPNKMKKRDRELLQLKYKQETPFEELFGGHPDEFVQFMKYSRNLDFEQRPNYQKLRQLFEKLMLQSNQEHDFEYDWVIKKR